MRVYVRGGLMVGFFDFFDALESDNDSRTMKLVEPVHPVVSGGKVEMDGGIVVASVNLPDVLLDILQSAKLEYKTDGRVSHAFYRSTAASNRLVAQVLGASRRDK